CQASSICSLCWRSCSGVLSAGMARSCARRRIVSCSVDADWAGFAASITTAESAIRNATTVSKDFALNGCKVEGSALFACGIRLIGRDEFGCGEGPGAPSLDARKTDQCIGVTPRNRRKLHRVGLEPCGDWRK